MEVVYTRVVNVEVFRVGEILCSFKVNDMNSQLKKPTVPRAVKQATNVIYLLKVKTIHNYKFL